MHSNAELAVQVTEKEQPASRWADRASRLKRKKSRGEEKAKPVERSIALSSYDKRYSHLPVRPGA